VIHTLSLDDDNQDAFARTGIIGQLEIQLNGGCEAAQRLAANTLTNIAKISISLRKQVRSSALMTSDCIAQISISPRNQVSLNLVKLLVSPSEDMRKRAGALLQDEKEGLGGASKQLQKETVIAGGVAPLVELLKDGGGYLEAHTYVLQSLSRMITDAISALMSL
jgi:hypothetical protein